MNLHTEAAARTALMSYAQPRVSELMSKPVAIIHYRCHVSEAAQLLISRRISGLPVVDDDKRLLGIVTEADFLKAHGIYGGSTSQDVWQTLDQILSSDFPPIPCGKSLVELMVTDVITVSPDHDLVVVWRWHRGSAAGLASRVIAAIKPGTM